MSLEVNTIQNATVAAEVNSGDVAVEAKVAGVAAAGSEQAVSATAPECRATDIPSEAVQVEVKAPAPAKMEFHPSLTKIAIEALSKKTYTGKVLNLLAPTSPVVLPFHKLEISKWNPSAAGARKEADIENLKNDIKVRGLINPICIVKTGKKDNGGAKFSVIAGAGRLAALKQLRGEDSGLMESEYKIVSKLDETNTKCASYSLAENGKRSNHSNLVMARFFVVVTKEQKIKEAKLAKDANMNRQVVSRLVTLGEHEAKLPASWIKDLDYTQPVGGKKVKKSELPRISFAHWETVAGLVSQKGNDATVQKFLTDTYEGKWKVAKLRKELHQRFPEFKGKSKGRPGFGKKADKDPAQDKGVTPVEVTQAEPVQAAVEKPQALKDDELEMLRQYRASKQAA